MTQPPTSNAASAMLHGVSTNGGFCECGCGQRTSLAKQNNRDYGYVRGMPVRFVAGHSTRVLKHVGADHHRWTGGRTICRKGYVHIHTPGHVRADRGGYVPEHVLLVEAALGRPFDRCHPVHHVDENKQNNANSNLVLCQDNAYHMLLHQRQRAMEACGDPNALRCTICKVYDRQDDIMQVPGKTGAHIYHRACFNAQRRERYRKQREELTLIERATVVDAAPDVGECAEDSELARAVAA